MKSVVPISLLFFASALAADPTTNPDHEFFQKAAAGGIAEVHAGKLAQTKGASAEVREFGTRMVEDHGKAHAKLQALAARKDVTLPEDTDAKHMATLTELQKVSGRAFDDAYIKAQVADHEATEALLKEELASGKDADARKFAQEILPTVSAHLRMVRALAGEATTSAATD